MARFTPEGFQPTKEKQEVSDLSSQYTFNPDSFDESKLDELELNASYYGVPFARSQQHQDNLIERTLLEAGKGFAEGFSANLIKFDPPSSGDNIASISRQLGSLAGFMGYIPGGKYLPILNKLRGASLPLKAATSAQKAITKVANPLIRQASKETRDFLSGNVIADVGAGAFQMGVASAVSGEWTEGVTTILKNAGYGAMYGGVARGIGNLTGLGKKITVNQLNTATGAPQLSKLADGQKFDLSMRVLANGTFDALSAKMQGQTTPEQVYNFVMGGFLGWKDLPFSTRTSQEFIWKTIQDKHIEDHTLHPEWDLHSKEMQEIITADMDVYFNPTETKAGWAKILGSKNPTRKEFFKSINKDFEENYEVGPDGVPIQKVTKEMVEQYVEQYSKEGSYKDDDELDMHIADVENLVGTGQPIVSWVGRTLGSSSEYNKIGISADLFKVWQANYGNGDNGPIPNRNAEEVMTKHIFDKYGVKLDEEGVGWWRRLGEEQRNRVFVPQLTIVDGKPSFLNGNVNAVGNTKDVKFQRPIIGDVLFKQYPKSSNKDFFTYLDHVIYEGKEYKLTEIESAIRVDIENKSEGLKESREISEEAKIKYREIEENLEKYMDSQGYYFVGGKGDKNARYYVLKHPFITSKQNNTGRGTKAVLTAVRNAFKDVEGTIKTKDLDDFIKKYKLKTKYDKESFASNVLYDLTWNGFDVKNLGTGKNIFATDLTNFLKGMRKKDFLNSAKAYNKRAQIWFNTGISADADNVSGLINSIPVSNGKLKYIIYDDSKDIENQKRAGKSGRGDKQEEFTDGAILGLKDVIRALNIDKGMPTSGNVNKSFIVSPDSKEGALLGKYMIHEPSKEMSKEMIQNGVHLLMPKSAVKQMGNRKIQDVYELPIEHIRTTMSEITSDKYIKPQRLPKQVMTVLSAFEGGKDNSNLFEKMYNDFSGKGDIGTDNGFKIAERFLKDSNEANTKELIDNFEDISIPTLFKILRDPSKEEASSGLMKKILKINDDYYRNQAEESEFSRQEQLDERLALVEYGTIIDRLMQIYPKGSTGASMHKFVRDFRMVALRNYAVHSYTRPKLEGSVVARIRPWDPGMRKTMDDINDDSKQIFYLDNGFKKTKIYDDRFDNGVTTLENLLKMTKDKSLSKGDRDDYLEMITALTTRVPMDSMSGANVLKLAGFTGIDGYGVLMHPRVMRALGGADLDGDKAFVFFGGKGGMKKEYKEMYQAARDEFFKEGVEQHNKDKYDIGRPKEKLRELFTDNDVERLRNANDPINYYSSNWRGEMSVAATKGRDILGTSVNTRSAILGAYNAIVKMGTGRTKTNPIRMSRTLEDGKMKANILIYQLKTKTQDKIIYEMPFIEDAVSRKGKEFYVQKKLKLTIDLKDKNAMQMFKERSRTAIAIGSDPMDEAGIKSSGEFKKLLMEPLFKKEVQRFKRGRWVKDKNAGDDFSGLMNKSLIGDFLAVNNALYGKNSNTGQRHSYADIKNHLRKLTKLPKSANNNVMVNLAKDINKINWSDNLYRRINFQSLARMYDKHKVDIKKYDWLKNILDRTTFSVTNGKLQKYVHKNNMWSQEAVKRYLSDDEAWYELYSKSPETARGELDVPNSLANNETFRRELLSKDTEKTEIKVMSPEYRSAWIDYMVLKSEDMLVNDMSDIATINRIVNIVEGKKILNSRIGMLFSKAKFIKDQSYHAQEARKTLEEEKISFDDNTRTINPDITLKNDKASAGADNVLIDMMIKKVIKDEQLNKLEIELFDTFLIGTLNKGNSSQLAKTKATIKRLERKRWDKRSDNDKSLLYMQYDKRDKLIKDSKNTSLMKVGLNSKVVSDESIKKFFDEYDSLYKKNNRELSDDEIKEIEESIIPTEGTPRLTSILDSNNKPVKGSILEVSDLSKGSKGVEGRFLDELRPFLGITKGKVKDTDILEAYEDIKRHLNHMHMKDAKNINFLYREVIGKDINASNKIDMLAFRNYLDDMHTSSFWRRSWDYLTGKKPLEIKRAYYMQFPSVQNKALIASSPNFYKFEKNISPYIDHLGNTIMGTSLTPITPMGMIQQLSAKSIEMSQQVTQEEKQITRDKLLPYTQSSNGAELYDIAVVMREKPIAFQNMKDKDVYPDEYLKNWEEVKPMYEKLKEVTFKIPLAEGVKIMSGKQAINNINNIITEQNKRIFKYITGDGKTAQEWLNIAKNNKGEVTFGGLQKLRIKWTQYLADKLRKNQPLPIEKIGIDGIQNIAKYIVQSHIPVSFLKGDAKKGYAKIMKIRETLGDKNLSVTEEYKFENYFPHKGLDRDKIKESYKFALEKLKENKELTSKEKALKVQQLFIGHRQLTGDYLSKNEMGENFDIMEEVIRNMAINERKQAEKIMSGGFLKAGSQFSRESHIGGWSRTPEAYDSYTKDIIDNFYRQAMQTANRSVIHEFGDKFLRKTKDVGLTMAWRRRFQLYANQAMGYPSRIPQKVMDDPLMKLNYTPYKFLSDTKTKERVDFIRKKLGIGRKILKEFNLEEEDIDQLSGVSFSQLEAYAAMEAKWQLASLLAHPKSAVANFYGGTIHTIINTGWAPFKNARSIEYLKAKVNSKWNSMADVESWLQKLGVTEDFLMYEVGLNPNEQSSGLARMAKDVSNAVSSGKKVGIKELNEIRRKNNLSGSAFKFASSFMRVPERALRRDAFMAHYLQARERFGNSIKDYDHPFLIEMAKKGVKATQFLYSAPYRPAWTTSTMGKIFSRFQLWSWNSVRFRRDTLRRAKIYGFVPGTEAHSNAVRMIQADAFMLGMASVYTYSLFESALPAPYNWLQDTADYFFGDEEKKDRAFFGSPFGPFQLVTPPFMRALPQLFKWMLNKDEEVMTEYVAWSLFPFGRIGRDIFGKGGIIENPYYAVTKMSGIPLIPISKDLQKIVPQFNFSDEEEELPTKD